MLDFQRKQDLAQFTHQLLFRGEEQVAGQLHGDGAAALRHLAFLHDAQCRADQALPVNAGVLVEAIVLGVEEGVDHHRRHVGQLDGDPALFAEFADQGAVAGVDAQRDLQLDVAKAINRRQAGQQGPDHAGRAEHGEQESQQQEIKGPTQHVVERKK